MQSSNLTNATAIGNGAIVNANNTIQLGNTSVVRIVTSGAIEAGGTVKAGAVTYPSTDGTTNQVLTTNGAGTLSWTNGIAAIPGSANATLRHNGTTWIANGNVLNDGNNLITTNDAQIHGLTVGVGAGGILTNTAVGSRALENNTTGKYNVASGYQALKANTTGEKNTASGYQALYSNTTGDYNTASGYQAIYSNTTGNRNTAIGTETLYKNTTGDRNTALGNRALNTNTTGNRNTAIGDSALFSNNKGSNNTALGYSATVSALFSNATAIGFGALANAQGRVQIGNSTVTTIGGYRAWTNVSDARFKKNIEEKVIGLDFIMALRPVTYNLDMDAIANFQETPDNMRSVEEEHKREQELETGFIAQEVELAAKNLGYDFNGINAPQHERDNYSLSYATFVVPLVKAMQEQQELIIKLQERISVLEKK